MAGRPPLPLGTHGKVRFKTKAPRKVEARTSVRDFDGRVREVSRTGTSRGDAHARLMLSLHSRKIGAGGGDLTPETPLSEAAAAWWSDFSQNDRSPNTLALYRSRLDKIILPALGGLRLRELTPGVVDRHLKAVARSRGPETARGTKAVLSGVCKFALTHDALERNPVLGVGTIPNTAPRKQARALTTDEAIDLRQRVWADQKALDRDIPALLDVMLATGLRRGEACALRWDAFDLDAGTVRVGEYMLINEKGKAPYNRSHHSSKLTPRELELPRWCVEMLRARQEWVVDEYVFPQPRAGGLRDLSNTSKQISAALKAAGYEWAVGHTLRKTVATLMDESGLSPRAAADQLGHSQPSMTQDRYMGRGRKSTGAREVLDRLDITQQTPAAS